MRRTPSSSIRRRALVAGAVLVALTGATAASASAATLSISTRTQEFAFYVFTYHDLRYAAAAGEANRVSVSQAHDGAVAWLDLAAPIHVPPADGLDVGDRSGSWGCVPVRAKGTLLGGPLAVGAALCTWTPAWDPPCLLLGGPACGQAGADEGFDRIRVATGDMDDSVHAVDGRRTVVDCGPGHDAVRADAADVLTNCEEVTRA